MQLQNHLLPQNCTGPDTSWLFFLPMPVEALPNVTQTMGAQPRQTAAEVSICNSKTLPTSQGGSVGTGRAEASTRRVRVFCQNRAAHFSGGRQAKTDIVKGIQISSIFQARGQDATHFWTHPTEILPKSLSNEIRQIHKTISRAATYFAVFAHANACFNGTIFIPDNSDR